MLSPFKLERYFARYEFTAPYLLCASDCEALSLEELLQLEPEAEKALRALRLGYVEPNGSLSIRECVAALFDGVAPDDVLLHAGSSEAIYAFMLCALNPGDHVIVQYPCYQSHYEVAKSIGCELTLWGGDERRGWELDIEFLRTAIQPNTRAVMLTAPHNPTGYLMSRAALDEMVSIVSSRGIYLFCDEIFRFIEQDAAQRLPGAAGLYERAVSIGGLSKTFGLPGVRVGWAVSHDRALLAKMMRLKDYLSLCNGATDEFLAGIALRHRAELHRRNLEIIIENLRLVEAFLERRADLFAWQRPRAGTVGLVRYLAPEGTAAFCERVVRACGVLLLPSAELEFGDSHFRIGFGRRDLPGCLARLEGYVNGRS
ncbi:MAG TPA: aminotransferase class I/II-fold pyridoxal phosphate-dependent enzyme [Candidatus Eremiobacteraceae bacterium]|nr:aminotransferase class I/II-fold pyridoxal phosphate-dependent enzyme [Candidatus Eremiobacteraceae bacterium]